MKLYFLRHADALDGHDDDARPLSARGQREANAIGEFLKRARIAPDAAYASPTLRTRQTVEIALKVCSEIRGKPDEALRNETPQDAFELWLAQLPAARHLLLVGHAPTLAERVGVLLGFKNLNALALPKAGLVCVETADRRRASLLFYVTPALLGISS